MTKFYITSSQCYRYRDTLNIERNVQVLFIDATSVEEAKGKAITRDEADHPSSEGWQGHTTVVHYALGIEELKACLDALRLADTP